MDKLDLTEVLAFTMTMLKIHTRDSKDLIEVWMTTWDTIGNPQENLIIDPMLILHMKKNLWMPKGILQDNLFMTWTTLITMKILEIIWSSLAKMKIKRTSIRISMIMILITITPKNRSEKVKVSSQLCVLCAHCTNIVFLYHFIFPHFIFQKCSSISRALKLFDSYICSDWVKPTKRIDVLRLEELFWKMKWYKNAIFLTQCLYSYWWLSYQSWTPSSTYNRWRTWRLWYWWTKVKIWFLQLERSR